MYAWRQLEPAKGRYDFSIVHEDLNYLQSKGKKLFIQLQDATLIRNIVPCQMTCSLTLTTVELSINTMTQVHLKDGLPSVGILQYEHVLPIS